MLVPSRELFWRATLQKLKSLVGNSRETSIEEINRMLAVSDLPPQVDGKPTSFCAAGIIFAACAALADANHEPLTIANSVNILRRYRPAVDANYLHTSPSCSGLITLNSGLWLPSTQIGNDLDLKPGWLVIYEWEGGDRHIGMIDLDNINAAGGNEFQTVEANTSCDGHSGVIAVKSRKWEFVLGLLRTY